MRPKLRNHFVFFARFICSTCKQLHSSHDCNTKKGRAPGSVCAAFTSSQSCSCGAPYGDHETVVETAAERTAAGRETDTGWMQKAAAEGRPTMFGLSAS